MKSISKLVKNMKPSGIREFFNYSSERLDVISLSVGQPDFVTPKAIREDLEELYQMQKQMRDL